MPAATGERDDDRGTGKADNIGHSVAVDIREQTRDLILSGPATRVGAELAQLESWYRKMPAAACERAAHPCLGKSDNIRHPLAAALRAYTTLFLSTGPATRE